jgi:hypothetical protein
MKTRIFILLFVLSLLSCRTAKDETKLPKDKLPASQEEAIAIAKQEFEKNLPGTLWSYDVISRPEENGQWRVLFAGYGQLGGIGVRSQNSKIRDNLSSSSVASASTAQPRGAGALKFQAAGIANRGTWWANIAHFYENRQRTTDH